MCKKCTDTLLKARFTHAERQPKPKPKPKPVDELPLIAACYDCGTKYGVRFNAFSNRFKCDAHS